MSKSVQIHIPKPCHENWQQMTPKEQGRFCGACQKTVVDFSMMTDKEVLNHLNEGSHNACGRFSRDQLNRAIEEPNQKRRFTWAYAWNLLLATLLLTESCQDERIVGELSVVRELKGQIIDDVSGVPVPGAVIRSKSIIDSVVTDSAGRFSIMINEYLSDTLEVSATAYDPQHIAIDSSTNYNDVKVALSPEHILMGDFTIEAPKSTK